MGRVGLCLFVDVLLLNIFVFEWVMYLFEMSGCEWLYVFWCVEEVLELVGMIVVMKWVIGGYLLGMW